MIVLIHSFCSLAKALDELWFGKSKLGFSGNLLATRNNYLAILFSVYFEGPMLFSLFSGVDLDFA